MAAAVNAAAVGTIKSIWNHLIENGGFAQHLSRVTILDGGNGSVTASMKVEVEHCNPHGTLHGAFASLLVDNLSGVGLLTHPNVNVAGSTVQLNMEYMSAARLGEEILIKSRPVKVGRQLAYLEVEIMNKATEKLIASGKHTIFMGPKGVPLENYPPKPEAAD